MKHVTLILDDGTKFSGESFGYEKSVSGEVVFNTAMTGYTESLTDPSYAGQIITLTFPLVGNYGVPPFSIESNGLPKFMESDKIHAQALIVSDYSEEYSHWNAVESLASWLKRERIPGITGIDTRELTKVLREHGVMMGRIVFEESSNDISSQDYEDYGTINYVDKISCKNIISYLPSGDTKEILRDVSPETINEQLSTNKSFKKVLLVDCGVKANIIRCLLERNVEVIRVPWDYDFTELKYDGLFISNGPGDPNTCEKAVNNLRKAMQNEQLPIFGICMGNQLLSKAGGAKIYKLKYGHRSHNQPVRMVGTNRCFITSQNHGYAVDDDTLDNDWEALFINMNDGSNEGIKHKRNPWFSAQFHPEATGGPTDTQFLFDEFINLLK